MLKKIRGCNFLSQFLCFFATLITTITAHATEGYNMPYGVTPISQDIYHLHMAAFYVCCGIGVLVFSVLIYSLIKFRKSKGATAAHFHEHLWVEIIWTTIPFLILVALAIPATIVLMRMHDTSKSALTIKVTGYQWKWKYEYLDQGISFFSNLSTSQEQINNEAPKDAWFLLEVDNPLVVPINTKIRVLVTSDDVIHSWWVPELGMKQDAVPGYINEAPTMTVTKVGTYRGQCGELCGVGHAFMPIVVQAVSKADFAVWVKAHQVGAATAPEQTIPEQELLKLGKAKYETSCAMCHQVNGHGLPPSFPPLKGSRVVTGPATANIAFVMQGVPGTAMQAFGEQLDDKSFAAIITYIRHSWGNDIITTKNKNILTVQPADIAKVRASAGTN